jgi:hypothetical protein
MINMFGQGEGERARPLDSAARSHAALPTQSVTNVTSIRIENMRGNATSPGKFNCMPGPLSTGCTDVVMKTVRLNGTGSLSYVCSNAHGTQEGCAPPPCNFASPQPQPTKVQAAFIEREIGALVIWALNKDSSGVKACSGCGWSLPSVVPAREFAPSVASADMAREWVAAASAFGAKSLTLAVNHCGGFALWPTQVSVPDNVNNGKPFRYNYSVAFSGIPQRDIVREFVDACKAGGMKPGLYFNIGINFFMDIGANGNSHSITPTGRFQACWDPKGYNKTLLPGQVNVSIGEYFDVVKAHMEELLGGGYGNDFVEVWLDGGDW